MLGLDTNDDNRRKNSPELFLRCTVSSIFGIFTQLALLSIPHFAGVFSLFFQLILSGFVLMIVTIFGQFVRRFLGVRASAPSFVFFHMIFIWSVYVIVIRHAVSPLIDILFNGMLACLLIGFYRMLVSDPGFVRCDLPMSVKAPASEDGAHPEELTMSETSRCFPNSIEEASLSARRVHYCRSCKAHILGFDHHCPAFGNCIGEKNHALFMGLLVGFMVTEALYALSAYQWTEKNKIHKANSSAIVQSLAISTMIFSLIQVLWQVAFFIWHVYCVCFNIRTEEWINWRRYPEFHVIAHPSNVTNVMFLTF
ncbi:hypothetical protein RND81_05G268800 [Saponaria officinalis]|uniref:S-acyltransferase n=1 Tax=Saponaria officinalis TaxID=3572 RepID=A0AAW1L262_SAPOF